MRSRQSWILKAGVALFSGALAVAAAEFTLRYWLHAAPQLELDLYARDAEGNLRLRPNITRRHVTRLWDVGIHIDGEGWRGHADGHQGRALESRAPQGPAPEGPAMVGLGDSMAFGWGVEFEESFLFLLEEQLRRAQPVRLVKAAVPGTGPGDQYRLLQSIWQRYEPRVVLLSFFVGNDFVDVQMGGAAQFDVEDGLLVRRSMGGESPSWLARARTRLIRSSHLLQLVRAVQLNWSRQDPGSPAGPEASRQWDSWLREFAQVHLANYPERTQTAVEQTLASLDELAAFCRQRSAPLILVAIPRSFQIYPEERREFIEALGVSGDDLDLDRPQRLLAEWASRRGALLVDLLPAFRLRQRENPEENLYHYPDAHMNAAGHRAAAAAVEGDAAAMDAIRSALAPAADGAREAASLGRGTPLQ
jgi:hypothetical protein